MRWRILSWVVWVLAMVIARPAGAEPASDDTPASQREARPPGPLVPPDSLSESERFVVIELHDEVGPGMAAFVQRVARDLEPGDVLVLDINTFGGQLPAAVTIRDTLLNVDAGITVVAYVNPRAISAGALISYAADVIVVARGATIGAATPVQLAGGEMMPVEEKVLAYMREEMRSTAVAQGRRGDVAEAMVDPSVEIDGLIDAGKTLALDGEGALQWGVASFEADDVAMLVEQLGTASEGVEVIHHAPSAAEVVAAWLTSSTVAALLMSLGMLGISIGLYLGGSPTALTFGGVCLALFFFGHMVVNLAGIEDFVLLGVGVVLISLEIIFPGHVFPGVIGVLCVLIALTLGLLDFGRVDFDVQWEAGYISDALFTVGVAVVTATGLGIAAARALPKSRWGRKIVLTAKIEARAADKLGREADKVIGFAGTAVSDLRPAGTVSIDGRRFDAVAQYGYIDAGSPVEVLRRQGVQLVVASPKENA